MMSDGADGGSGSGSGGGVGGDRFIPNRTSSNFDSNHYKVSPIDTSFERRYFS